VRVVSVDLVDDPATVKGLYEARGVNQVKVKFRTWLEHFKYKLGSKLTPVKADRVRCYLGEMDKADSGPAELAGQEMDDPGEPAEPDAEDPVDALTRGFKTAILAIFGDAALDAKTKAKKIAKAIKHYHDLLADDSAGPDNVADETEESDEDEEDKKDMAKAESKKQQKPPEGQSLPEAVAAELAALRAEKKLRERREQGRALCVAAKLPAALITEHFLAILARCESEAEMKLAIEDRKLIDGQQTTRRPTSSAPVQEQQAAKASDLKTFAELAFKGTGLK